VCTLVRCTFEIFSPSQLLPLGAHPFVLLGGKRMSKIIKDYEIYYIVHFIDGSKHEASAVEYQGTYVVVYSREGVEDFPQVSKYQYMYRPVEIHHVERVIEYKDVK
jgi:hypothetical protein